MHIRDVLAAGRVTSSFEFFPPRSAEAAETLYATIAELEPLAPSFVSVTYGAGGATRELTHALVERIGAETTLDAIPHLTCVGHSAGELEEIVGRYAAAGVSAVLALGGDPPRDQPDYDRGADAFRHAAQLVTFLREYRHPGEPRGFGVGVAGFPEGHPDTPNRLREMDYLKAKVDAGADYIVTQMFFDNRDFYDFRDRCLLAGITVPILAGIMPVASMSGLRRMAELAAGARFPAPLLRALARVEDDPEAVTSVGLHWATEQCRDLLDHNVRGLHFYTLNRSNATREIYRTLGLRNAAVWER
ncbi:MAG TPA: methylenetetrahydrofolate reductase [NAD(P)H] [Armatimonadetes bacterium]|nr:methylenetetrahydrofolate reductase [NAD(P)H] [Armatimonadota bacterium]